MVLWTDQNIYGFDNKIYITDSNKNSFSKKIEYILKTKSETSVAFLRSEFFRISLDMCKTFRLITSKSRDDDVGYRFDTQR